MTSVELLPVHIFVSESQLIERGFTSYWGYNSIGFFAPDPRYAADVPNSLREFTEMVARFDEAGLGVILDVVYAPTRQGNNNAYCQDSEIGWIDWRIGARGSPLIRFVQRLTALRQEYPILRRNRFLAGECNAELEVKDVTWIDPTGKEMAQSSWQDLGTHYFGMLIGERAQPTGIRQRGREAPALIVFNAHHEIVKLTLPECIGSDEWSLLIDTDRQDDTRARVKNGAAYDAAARSLLLFRHERASG